MMLITLVIGAVQSWTRLYTCGINEEAGARRRAEVHSDIHEQLAAEGMTASVAARMFLRMLAGVHDDVVWRVERRRNERRTVRLTAIGIASICLAGALWLLPAAFVVKSPPVPPAPEYRSRRDLRPLPPPPPPPPPLCNPADTRKQGSSPCTIWP
jgi:hypothetical protein